MSAFRPNVFKSSDPSAPVMTGTGAGTLLGVLDHCLVIGRVFGYSGATSGYTDNSVEARTEGAPSFAVFPDGLSGDAMYLGQCARFAAAGMSVAASGVGGAYAWEYWNGSSWTALTVSDGTAGFVQDGVVTWTKPGDWATTTVNAVNMYWVRVRCTSTPSTNPTVYSITATGWLVGYTTTYTRAYRTSRLSPRRSVNCSLYIDDSAATPTAVRGRGYEWIDKQAPSGAAGSYGPFPTEAQVAGGLYFRRSFFQDGAASKWIVVADDRTMYVFVSYPGYDYWAGPFAFGEFYSYVGELHRTMIIAHGQQQVRNTLGVLGANVTATLPSGHFFEQAYSSRGPQEFGMVADSAKAPTADVGGDRYSLRGNVAYPNPADGGAYLVPVMLYAASHVRGHLRGAWCPLHAATWAADGDTFSGQGALAGRTFLVVKEIPAETNVGQSGVDGSIVIETSDTWDTN